MKKSLLIIDGLNYLFRAYFGITDAIKLKNGQSVNAVFGFFAFLREAVTAASADYILVVFDAENAVEDKQQYFEGYKANREYADLRMFDQLIIIKEILSIMGIKHIEEDRMEADDLIGTYSEFGSLNDCIVYISSNDYDFIQLIKGNIKLIRNSKGVQNIYNSEKVLEQFNIIPEFYADYAALVGDKSDNIKGVPGIGKKTAAKLINEYSSVENILLNIERINIKVGKKLEAHHHQLLSYKEIIKINCNLKTSFLPISDLTFDNEKLFNKTREYLNKIDI